MPVLVKSGVGAAVLRAQAAQALLRHVQQEAVWGQG